METTTLIEIEDGYVVDFMSHHGKLYVCYDPNCGNYLPVTSDKAKAKLFNFEVMRRLRHLFKSGKIKYWLKEKDATGIAGDYHKPKAIGLKEKCELAMQISDVWIVHGFNLSNPYKLTPVATFNNYDSAEKFVRKATKKVPEDDGFIFKLKSSLRPFDKACIGLYKFSNTHNLMKV